MKKYIFSTILFVFFIPLSLVAQQKAANISFDKTLHEFGEFQESDGVQTHKFEFTNTGSLPLIIQRVSSSCGCTTPSWSKEPILPGEKGYVSAAYNPKNRPGHFDKYITVQSNAATSTVRLRISGKVIPKPLSIEEEYRYDMSGLRLKTNHLSFGTVYKGQEKSKMLELINNSDKPIKIEVKPVPGHLQVKTPGLLQPKEKSFIEVDYISDNHPDWDFVIDRLNVYINGNTNRTHRLIISASLQEDFTGLTEADKEKAPKIVFDEKVFNFNKIKQGEKLDHSYTFTNTGKSDLVIRKVKASCGCTAIMTTNKVIKPGETGEIKMAFNSTGRLGNQNKTITIITNDPDNPRELLWIRGEVTKE